MDKIQICDSIANCLLFSTQGWPAMGEQSIDLLVMSYISGTISVVGGILGAFGILAAYKVNHYHFFCRLLLTFNAAFEEWRMGGEICGEEREGVKGRRVGTSWANYVCLCVSVSLCKNTGGAWHGKETEGAKGSEVRKARMQRRRELPALDWYKMVLSRALAALVTTRSESSPMRHVLY